MKSEIIEWIKALAIALIIGLGASYFITVLQVFDVSMNPTLVEGDRLLLVNTHQVHDGEICIFETKIPISSYDYKKMNIFQRYKNGKYKTLIKRVIATEGDSLDIHNGIVIRNGKQMVEPYIKDGYTPGDIHIDKLPKGMVFAMGDNRLNSHDSRSEDVGPVQAEKIRGKVVFRFWPLNKIGPM